MSPHINHDLDVEGDVILTLENPNEPFAIWADEGEFQELPQTPPPLVLDPQVIRRFRQIDPAVYGKSRTEDSWNWAGFQVAPVQAELPETEGIDEATEGAEAPVDVSYLSMQGTQYVSDPSEGT